MSHSGKPNSDLGINAVANRLRDSLSCDVNKPDFRELDIGSPVSPLRTRTSGHAPSASASAATTTTSSSSSSSSGSVTGRTVPNPVARRSEPSPKNHSGELSGSTESSPRAAATRNLKPGQSVSSDSGTQPLIYSGQSSVTSPPVNVLPAGNICPSGRILKTGMATTKTSRTDVLRSGSGNYGHGSIMRGGVSATTKQKTGAGDSPVKAAVSRGNLSGYGGDMRLKTAMTSSDPEEIKKLGNEMYNKGCFVEALSLYDRAVALSPANAACRSNRAAALSGLGRFGEAVRECEEAVRLDPSYARAHQRLASLLLRLGQVECARKHFCISHQQGSSEMQKLQLVETHLNKCVNARKVADWKSALREADASIASGADFSPQLVMCRVEALLKLHQLRDAELTASSVPKVEPFPNSCSQTRFFGMLSEAFPFFVKAQIEMALGRFENAVTAVEKASQIDPRNMEVSALLNNVKLVSGARARGNDLFKSERFTEACSAYTEGLKFDPSNSVLYCNRAACSFKLGMWERSIDDCNQALRIQPNYTKAVLRRAASNSKLEKWADAVRDYEVLRSELPDNTDVAESLFHAQVALKKSRGEEVHNLKFGGDVEEVLSIEQFRAAIALPGISVVHFETPSDSQCKLMSPFMDTLCKRYPSVNFLKVDIGKCLAIAEFEEVRVVPTFKIYKNGTRVKEFLCPSREMLEYSVRRYSH